MVFHIIILFMSIKVKKMVGAKHVPFPHAYIDPDSNSNKI